MLRNSFVFLVLLVGLAACTTHHQIESKHEVAVAPVEVKPIHITIDINIKVDRDLENFFGDIDQAAQQKSKGGTK